MLKKILLAIFILIFIFGAVVFYFNSLENSHMIYGASFSPEYAGYLKTDPQESFTAILDKFGFRYLRLTAQWNKLEKAKGQWDFSELDWFMDEAGKRKAKVVLAVGQKIPRWPECYAPVWAAVLPDESYQEEILILMRIVVERYRNHPALEIWQVENEPFLSFGENCRLFDASFLAKELSLVNMLDPEHQTLVTDSGELSTWRKTAKVADLFGTTLYRMVWNKYWGYLSYEWLPPAFYRFKLWVNGRAPETAFITELQAEPWIPGRDIHDTSLQEQYRSMDLERLKKNVSYAARTGFARAYLWGAEWWYWLEVNGHGEIADYIKGMRKN